MYSLMLIASLVGLWFGGCDQTVKSNSIRRDSIRRDFFHIGTIQHKAEFGDVSAQLELGLLYRNGDGVPRNYKEAVKWFMKAAEKGNESAQLYLGEMYTKGDGVPKDDKEAVKWFMKAARQGNATLQFQLGQMYANGQFVPKDFIHAYAWYNLAASNGIDDAKEFRDSLEANMGLEQISKAQELSREFSRK